VSRPGRVGVGRFSDVENLVGSIKDSFRSHHRSLGVKDCLSRFFDKCTAGIRQIDDLVIALKQPEAELRLQLENLLLRAGWVRCKRSAALEKLVLPQGQSLLAAIGALAAHDHPPSGDSGKDSKPFNNLKIKYRTHYCKPVNPSVLTRRAVAEHLVIPNGMTISEKLLGLSAQSSSSSVAFRSITVS